MRNAFTQELTRIATEDPKIILLSGDIGNKLFDEFKGLAPDRFYNCGVAEANMTGVAAGMALMGFRPITYTITPFAVFRCFEQIRLDVCYHNLPVIIVGTGSGLSYAELGPTHHSCDDIGVLRMLPNMTIVCPCDPLEVRLALRSAVRHDGPVYLRLGKKGEPPIHKTVPDFVLGKSITVREGGDVCILSTGNAMLLALSVAEALNDKKLSARVESFHTVKPLDAELLDKVSRRYPVVVTIEEHSLIGGLGSAVAEWREDHAPLKARLLRFGTADRFLAQVGSQEYARKCFGLTTEQIVDRIVRESGLGGRTART
jgi:transketolase